MTTTPAPPSQETAPAADGGTLVPSDAAQQRSGGRNRQSVVPARVVDGGLSALVAVALILLAEVAANREWVSPLILPQPSHVWDALVDGWRSGLYTDHILSTVGATLAGFLVATAAAVALAGIFTGIPRLERIFLPFVVAFQTLPKIAIAPIIILWLGFGTRSKIVIVATICVFPILVNTLQGLRLRDQERLELFRSLGASRWQLFRHLRIPDALPYIFAGLNIGVVFALIGTVLAEFLGSESGIGVLLVQQQVAFNPPGMYAALLLLMVVGLILNGLIRLVERKVLFWAPDLGMSDPLA
jgi:NitT/TauT family transport system permease protein